MTSSIESYRAAIGKWHLFCIIRPRIESDLLLIFIFFFSVTIGRCLKVKDTTNSICIRLALLLSLLVVICGSVELNPGPLNDLKISHVNMRSLQPHDRSTKLDEMYSTLCIEEKCDVICISETWLDHSIDDVQVNLPGYQIYRRDRNRHGGGVAIYASNSIPVKQLQEFNIDGVEIVCIEVKLMHKKILISCIYRPPGSGQQADDFLEDFQNIVNLMISKDYESLFILGDFNDRCMQWNDTHSTSELGLRLKNSIEGNLLFQIVTEPTHYGPNLHSLLDLIITDSPAYILDCGVGTPIGDPYHCYIFCKLSLRYNTDMKYQRTLWQYKEANIIELNNVLTLAPWDTMFVFDDINDITDYFTDLLLDECAKHIPKKTVTIKPSDKPWITAAIKHKLNVRNKFHKRWKRSKADADFDCYKIKRIEANVAMSVAKVAHFERIKERLCDPSVGNKEYWHLLKSLYGNKIDCGIPSLIDSDKIYATSSDKATIFNKHFLEKSLLPTTLPTLPLPNTFDEFSLSTIQITQDDVKKVLKSLNIKKATGCDSISNYILKSCAPSISAPLTKLFQKSINCGKYPDSWKLANITPVFKKGNKQDKNNYRPISILPNIGKVFE